MSDMWESVAPGWEANAQFVDGHLAQATDALLDAAGVGEGTAVLDLGCGAGGAGLAAARRVGTGGSVVLSDVAPAMVAAAGRRATGMPQVATAIFDQSAIDAPDGRFDAVISRHALMFVEDPATVIREIGRVLRPGGRYATMTWAPREQNPWLGLTLDAVGAQFGVPFPPPGVRGPFSLTDPALLASALRDGGLDDVATVRIDTPLRADSVKDWWDRVLQLAGPLAMALAGMEPEVRDAIGERARAAAASAARHEQDGIVLDGAVLIASGTVPGQGV